MIRKKRRFFINSYTKDLFTKIPDIPKLKYILISGLLKSLLIRIVKYIILYGIYVGLITKIKLASIIWLY